MNSYKMRILSTNPLLIAPVLSVDIAHAGNAYGDEKHNSADCTETEPNNSKDSNDKENLEGRPDIDPQAR
jgi:hypothetical protein